MNVDIFTLCDNAQDYNGKMIITGTFNQFKVSEFPGMSSPFSVAIRIVVEANETLEGVLNFTMKNNATGEYIIVPVKENIPERKNIEESGTLNLVINYPGVMLPAVGAYEMKLIVNNKTWISTIFAEKA